MKKMTLGYTAFIAVLIGLALVKSPSAKATEPTDKKCKTDHALAGLCCKSTEGTWECMANTQDKDCCHSAS